MSEILECCKTYVIERVINPGLYWMSEYGDVSYKKEIERFEELLRESVRKCEDDEKINIGKICAIKDENGFHRGVVTDAFNRSSQNMYNISLIDYGKTVETNQENIYFIKNKELKNKRWAYEVSLHGVKPTAVELAYDKNFSDGIFEKKVSHHWSPRAFKFIEDIVKENPYVYVKAIKSKKRNISGEIYIIDEHTKMFVSLGEKLCSAGFASPKLTTEDNVKGADIDEKIPNAALCKETQKSELPKSQRLTEKEDSNIGNTKKGIYSPFRSMLQKYLSCKSTDLPAESYPNLSSSLNTNSSLILKKCESITSSPCDSSKKVDSYHESEEKKSDLPENFDGSIFRVVVNNIEEFKKSSTKP